MRFHVFRGERERERENTRVGEKRRWREKNKFKTTRVHYLVGQTKIICLPLLLLLGARAQGLLLAEYNGINLHQNDLLNFFINVDATNGQKGAMNNLKLMAARVGETGGGIGRSTGPNDQKRRKQKRSGQNNAGNQ